MNHPTPPAEVAALKDAMQKHSLLPLWEIYEKVVTHEPSMAVPSHHWSWADLEPAVELSTRTVHGKDADHRVLVLRNPHIPPGPPATATNILGAIQCVLPGERTSPHRHTPAAVRIVLEGYGGATFVDGVRCDMHTGDFIVTPNWTWHCHHNDSDRPVTWVDILDVPLAMRFNAIFGEYGGADTYPQTLGTLPDAFFERGGLTPVSDRPSVPFTPRFRYSWRDVAALLDQLAPAADGTRALRYTNPLDGGPVIPTFDVGVMRLACAHATQPKRAAMSQLCVVLDGHGKSTIGGVTHEWGPRSLFTVPEWQWASHTAAEVAHLVIVTDRVLRERIGLYREELQR